MTNTTLTTPTDNMHIHNCDDCGTTFEMCGVIARHEANSGGWAFCGDCCKKWDADSCDDCGNPKGCCECEEVTQ